jgi:outer membrane immunogenic protein
MRYSIAVIAAVSAIAFSQIASAADLPRKAPAFVPPPAPVFNWTGIWISGGVGYGIYDIDHSTVSPTTGAIFDIGHDNSGRGWLGKVGIGGDYQFAGPLGNWTIGAFADAQWTNIKGDYSYNCPDGCNGPTGFIGERKLDWTWAAGGRLGYVALPGLLTYVNGGYTQARFDDTNLLDATGLTATMVSLPKRTYNGWFLGGGTEFAINLIPGLFWKNEYRFADYGSKDDFAVCVTAGCGGIGTNHALDRARPRVQTITTELVYRFNWR